MMKRFSSLPFYLITAFILAFVPVSASLAQSRTTQQTASNQVREVLTNEAVIKLAREHFKERTIIQVIRRSPTAFNLSTAKLVELKRSGVSERVITEMIERQTVAAEMQGMNSLRDDEFFKADDEAFFNSVNPRQNRATDQRNKNNAPVSESETPVFGEHSGTRSKSSSRSPGGNGEHSNQNEVSGTATVRIIRPTTEGSEPKLEHAPKLDNQAVVELIQAGFSEGTILRKIEITQVDFDVSAKALAELRRNRVSERVIRAMSEAMK